MDSTAELVLAVAGVSVTVILGALLAIARRDRRLAEGRTSAARTIEDGHAFPVGQPAPPPPTAAAPPPFAGPAVLRFPPVAGPPVATPPPRHRRLPRLTRLRRVGG